MDALNSGRINGASVLAELAMAAVSNGLDLKAVALGCLVTDVPLRALAQ